MTLGKIERFWKNTWEKLALPAMLKALEWQARQEAGTGAEAGVAERRHGTLGRGNSELGSFSSNGGSRIGGATATLRPL
jgi:hypothetical protein